MMRLLLISDTYPPARISGALQMRDLAQALAAQGHQPLVLTPALGGNAGLRMVGGVQELRVSVPRTKDVPYWRRTLSELVLPWILLRGLKRSALRTECWDGVVWYSPSIFLGPLVRASKRNHRSRAYLIVRDLFPDWAVDAGVLRKGGLSYRFFKAVERYQYRQADVIGVQTPSNVPLVKNDAPPETRIEVLHNWLSAPRRVATEDGPSLGALEGRVNFIYAGNMGVAQDLGAFIELARSMGDRQDVGFVFVGRGSEVQRLQVEARELPNVRVLDEIAPEALASLMSRCHVGIIALHPAHNTHNIPGKLLTYLHAGLPVLARINSNNDLVDFVEEERIGLVVAGPSAALLHANALRLADDPKLRRRMGLSGIGLAERMFSPASAAHAIVRSLSSKDLRKG